MLDSSTVMTPSLPTLSMASAIISPIAEIISRDERGGGDLLAHGLHVLGELGQLLAHRFDRRLDAALERHRVCPGRHVAQALADECLGQHGGGRRAVAGDVVGLLRYFLDQLGTDLLPRVLKLDLLGDGNTIVGDRGGAPLLLENDVPALRAEGNLHGVGELVHAALEAAPGFLVKRDQLRCHWLQSSVSVRATGRRPRRTACQGAVPSCYRAMPRRPIPPYGCHSPMESANAMFSTRRGRVQTPRRRTGRSRRKDTGHEDPGDRGCGLHRLALQQDAADRGLDRAP